jgi:hypothetical protein
MPKFNVLKSGINEALITSTQQKVERYMGILFHEYEIVKIDDFYTFSFGSITVTVQVLPWHSEDVLVKVYSYLGDETTEITAETRDELIRLNATIPFGSFGVTFEKQAIFSYSLAGANLDLNEFEAAVQMVAKTADEYDETVRAKELVA